MSETKKERVYAAIDLKSYYASAECVERKLDPMTTHLVVADPSRTEKTICLAVSPSLKAYGIPGRARLFEVVEAVRKINAERLKEAIRRHVAVKVTPEMDAPGHREVRPEYTFASSSFDARALAEDVSLELTYIIAPPQMNLYMQRSAEIYEIYLKYVAPEDIVVYSIDECFLDLTNYLKLYDMTARELTMTIIREVLYETGITATAGIGSNLYLAKVAMDIMAKREQADANGVRIAELNEESYRRHLWTHQPLTDFWRVGSGTARKLQKHQMYTMGDVARCSVQDANGYCGEEMLYKLFGKNAELLIDHAWGYEPVTIEEIKKYKPASNSLSSGQVLHEPYTYEKTRLIVREMIEVLVLDMVSKGMATDQIVMYIGYEALEGGQDSAYEGKIHRNFYGKNAPKPAGGSISLGKYTSSTKWITEKTMELFERIADRKLLVRRVNIAAEHLKREDEIRQTAEQMSLFTDYEAQERARRTEEMTLKKEKSLQQAMLGIKSKFGKNAILKGMNLEEGGTMRERNEQVGGHKA